MKQQQPKSRKRKTKTAVTEAKKVKTSSMHGEGEKEHTEKQKPVPTVSPHKELTMEEMAEQYPVLKNAELVKRFLGVTMTNNQKGRIRQLLKDNLKGTSDSLLPDVIHNRIQAILKSSADLSDSDLRKLRILHNMLITAAKTVQPSVKKEKPIIKHPEKENKEGAEKEKSEQKVKGPKRYVVFVGNLPLDIDKPKILQHFSELGDHVKSLRLPKQAETKKSAIAYLEVSDEQSYELALSKHHSMLENKRINVLYTTQQKTKISKTEAKGKSAKLIALQKSGKLIGSVPLNRKRSARRNKLKAAQKKLAEGAA